MTKKATAAQIEHPISVRPDSSTGSLVNDTLSSSLRFTQLRFRFIGTPSVRPELVEGFKIFRAA